MAHGFIDFLKNKKIKGRIEIIRFNKDSIGIIIILEADEIFDDLWTSPDKLTYLIRYAKNNEDLEITDDHIQEFLQPINYLKNKLYINLLKLKPENYEKDNIIIGIEYKYKNGDCIKTLECEDTISDYKSTIIDFYKLLNYGGEHDDKIEKIENIIRQSGGKKIY